MQPQANDGTEIDFEVMPSGTARRMREMQEEIDTLRNVIKRDDPGIEFLQELAEAVVESKNQVDLARASVRFYRTVVDWALQPRDRRDIARVSEICMVVRALVG